MNASHIPDEPGYSRQLHLPIFPAEGLPLGDQCSVVEREGTVWYFHYDMPVFSHPVEDQASFRMFTSSLCDQGLCRLVEIERTFFVSAISVKRALKQFREEGIQSFFVEKKKKERKPRVFDEATCERVQALLDSGLSPREIEDQTGIPADTTRRAILKGRLHRSKKKVEQLEAATIPAKSERSALD
ncbi:MAG: hypothetical protein DRQ64_10000, partial [Gammaproteobacteria bacterium]